MKNLRSWKLHHGHDGKIPKIIDHGHGSWIMDHGHGSCGHVVMDHGHLSWSMIDHES